MDNHHCKPYEVKVTIGDRSELEDRLDKTVEHAIAEALRNPGHGLLVTRHDAHNFTVELSREVPQGTILEHDARSELTPAHRT